MRIVTYSHDIISLLDSEFIAASLQDGLFTFTRPNGQVVEVKLPTRAEIEKLSQNSSVSEGRDAQTSPVSITYRPSLSVNTPPKAKSSTAQAVVTNLPSITSAPESKNKIGLFQTVPGPDPTNRESLVKPGSSLRSSGSSSLFAPPVTTPPRTQKLNGQVAELAQDMGTNNTKTKPANNMEKTGHNAEKDPSLMINVTPPSCSPHSSNIPFLEPTNLQHPQTGGNCEFDLYLRQLEDLKVRVTDLQSMWNEADVKGLSQKFESLKKSLDVVNDDYEKFVFPAIEEVQDKIDSNGQYIEDVENKMYEHFENLHEEVSSLESKVYEIMRNDPKRDAKEVLNKGIDISKLRKR